MEGTRAVRVVRGLASLTLSIRLAWTRILCFLEGYRHLSLGHVLAKYAHSKWPFWLCSGYVVAMFWQSSGHALILCWLIWPCSGHAHGAYTIYAMASYAKPRCAQAGLVPCPSNQRASGHPMDIQNEVLGRTPEKHPA